MRIAYICADPGIPVFGQKGCSIHVQEVIRALQRHGATVELFTPRLGGLPAADLRSVKVRRLPPIPKGDLRVREQTALATNPDLQRELELAGPFDLIYERYSLWSDGAMEFAQLTGTPALLEVNAPLIEEQMRHRGLIHHAKAEAVARRAFQAATHLIAVSQPVKDYLTRWVTADRVTVIPNGVNHHRISPAVAPSQPSREDTFVVGFVGSLKPWHGLEHLVNAFDRLFQRVPQARLMVVGDGPERRSLEMALTQRGLQSVAHLTGAVAPEEIPGLLTSMDAAIAPYPASAAFYFSPLKVMEYLAAGLPVVVSDIGQLAEVITPDVTGLLCPPGDADALAAALERLWRSPHLRRSLGQAARQHILTHHTWDGVAQQILTLANLAPLPLTEARSPMLHQFP